EKPLYLYENGSGLYFASEIKALLRIPGLKAAVNLEGVWDYLAYRYVPGPKTLFTGIRKLMPGTTATWESGKLKEERYWTAPDRSPRCLRNVQRDAVAAFLSRLDEAVRLQMVSDVPFGAFLSGGLDSSTIVALMSRRNSKVNTFSVGFGEGSYSELAYASEVVEFLGTRHHEIVVNYGDMIERLPQLVAYRDAPVSEPADIPIYLLAREAARSVKMVLTGEGSDELLGGYPKHIAERFARDYQLLPRSRYTASRDRRELWGHDRAASAAGRLPGRARVRAGRYPDLLAGARSRPQRQNGADRGGQRRTSGRLPQAHRRALCSRLSVASP